MTTLLFPPTQLTTAVRAIAHARALLAAHLEDIAAGLREGGVPGPGEWRRGVEAEAAVG